MISSKARGNLLGRPAAANRLPTYRTLPSAMAKVLYLLLENRQTIIRARYARPELSHHLSRIEQQRPARESAGDPVLARAMARDTGHCRRARCGAAPRPVVRTRM